MNGHRTTFRSLLDLASLDWFDVVDGRLVADPEVGPIIDMHTHLAMGYVRKLRVDVTRATSRTAHYLPHDAPIDLDPYSNRNLDDAALFAMKLDLSVLSVTARGQRTTHTAPNLLADMDDMGIGTSVLLPIDMPIGPSNAEVVFDVAAFEPRLVPFGSVHPVARHPERRLDAQIERGARGMKFHPTAQLIAADNPRVVRWCGLCGDRGLPVLAHCGPVGIEPDAGRRRSQVVRYEAAIAENPQTTFVLGHCGALQHRIALDRLVRYPNVVVELSSLGLSAIAEVLERVEPNRIVYGTDWPFYHQALTLARVLIATDHDPSSRRAILHDNAAKLLTDHTPTAAPSVGGGPRQLNRSSSQMGARSSK